MASAGETVIRSLGMIARWLGPVGAGVLALLTQEGITATADRLTWWCEHRGEASNSGKVR